MYHELDRRGIASKFMRVEPGLRRVCADLLEKYCEKHPFILTYSKYLGPMPYRKVGKEMIVTKSGASVSEFGVKAALMDGDIRQAFGVYWYNMTKVLGEMNGAALAIHLYSSRGMSVPLVSTKEAYHVQQLVGLFLALTHATARSGFRPVTESRPRLQELNEFWAGLSEEEAWLKFAVDFESAVITFAKRSIVWNEITHS
jgi:hypothetical protein